MKEVWKDIPEYAGSYQASNLGRIRSVTRLVDMGRGFVRLQRGIILKSWVVKGGWLQVSLCKQGKRLGQSIHRLVLLAFVGPCPEGMECCHNDGNGKNNRLDNLRWDTSKANAADRKRHGVDNTGLTYNFGVTNYNAKLNDRKVRRVRKLWQTGRYGVRQLGRMFGVGHTQILNVINNVTWRHVV